MSFRRLLAVALTLATGCSGAPAALTPTATPSPAPTAPASTPTTPITSRPATTAPAAPSTSAPGAATRTPWAARVNGQDISRGQFEAELARYVAADPTRPDPSSAAGRQLAAQLSGIALDALIDRALLDQEARRLNIAIADRDVDDEIQALVKLRNGRDGYLAWLKTAQMTEADARELARSDLVLAALRERIVSQLPRTAEYIHAYHIVVATRAEAERLLAQAQAGGNFSAMAQAYSIDASTRPAGGDLGWFARGTGAVVWEEIEDAAFALKTNTLSSIVSSPIGFHIVKVVERQTRALTAEDQARAQQAAMEQYLIRLRSSSTIERAN